MYQFGESYQLNSTEKTVSLSVISSDFKNTTISLFIPKSMGIYILASNRRIGHSLEF